jgi:hypothetical protein
MCLDSHSAGNSFQVERMLLESLESKNELDREGGCRGLAIIGPSSKTIAPLAFLANSDSSPSVR